MCVCLFTRTDTHTNTHTYIIDIHRYYIVVLSHIYK